MTELRDSFTFQGLCKIKAGRGYLHYVFIIGINMLKNSLLLIYLGALGFFNMSAAHAMFDLREPSYSDVDRKWRGSGHTLGALIESNQRYTRPILNDCSALTKIEDCVLSPVSPKEVVDFFEIQELAELVPKPIIEDDNRVKTYGRQYGYQWPDHGPVEEKVISLIKGFIHNNVDVKFLDIGAGYGKFAETIRSACSNDLDKISIYVNEHIFVQCYHIAQLLQERPNVWIYPGNILQYLEYCNLDCTFNVSTIFNVHHFMPSYEFEDSLVHAYKITKKGGYHIAVAHSPYLDGDNSSLASAYERRLKSGDKYPGHFKNPHSDSPSDSQFFLSTEEYKREFTNVGFEIVDSGYYSNNPLTPREFSYIIGHKPK